MLRIIARMVQMIPHTSGAWLGLSLLLLLSWNAAAEEPSNPATPSKSGSHSELSLFEDIPMVVTASKKHERVTESPSIISIITEKEIRRMGARTLMDVLRAIPGIEIMTDAYHISQIAVRGLRSETSSGVKILIDGHALNDPITGGATEFYDNLPLKNVRRIEVIRGPASSIYGANAFVSVINIITKDAEDVNGTDISVGIGSFRTLNVAFQVGRIVNNLEFSLYADYYRTDGAKTTITTDSLSLYDEGTAGIFPPISFAPGELREARERWDLALKLKYHNLTLNAGFRGQERGPFLTDNFILNENSSEDFQHRYTTLSYRRFVTERLEVSGKVYGDAWDGNRQEHVAAGIRFAIPPDARELFLYPDGLIGNIATTAWRIGAESQVLYRLLPTNDLTVGLAYEYQAVDDFRITTNQENYRFGLPPHALVDLANLVPELRTSSYEYAASLYAQDTWKLRRNLDLTLGLRGDYFQEFGGVITPKAGVTYQPDPDLNIKALIGTAFRVPSFLETSVQASSAQARRDDLVVESLGTFEIGAGYQPFDWVVGEVNYFYTEIRKLAETTDLAAIEEDSLAYPAGSTQIYESIGGIDVQGVEVEFRGESEQELDLGILPRVIGSSFRLNYSYQDTKDSETHAKVPKMARHKGNLGLGLNLSAERSATGIPNVLELFRPFSDEFTLYLNLFLCGARERSSNDVRGELPAFALLDVTLTAYDMLRKGLGFSVSVKNLLDTDYRDPSGEFAPEVPSQLTLDDFPNPGRSIFVELRYTF